MEAAKKFPNDADSIKWSYKILKNGNFSNPDELKAVFSSLDNFKYKDRWWVIDIGGNNLRLLAFIEFKYNKMYVKHIVTHTEYDKLCKQYSKTKRK